MSNTIYRLVQFAIREAVATRTLDEILAARDTIDREVRAFVTERAGDLGVEIGEIGVKDVILPGDVRDLLNKVVEAERTAKANLIRRQEETAATRSLLNTARLMEDNPLLLRLKELEALEKLVEKVGRIDLHTGGAAPAASTPCCRTSTACAIRRTGRCPRSSRSDKEPASLWRCRRTHDPVWPNQARARWRISSTTTVNRAFASRHIGSAIFLTRALTMRP